MKAEKLTLSDLERESMRKSSFQKNGWNGIMQWKSVYLSI